MAAEVRQRPMLRRYEWSERLKPGKPIPGVGTKDEFGALVIGVTVRASGGVVVDYMLWEPSPC